MGFILNTTLQTYRLHVLIPSSELIKSRVFFRMKSQVAFACQEILSLWYQGSPRFGRPSNTNGIPNQLGKNGLFFDLPTDQVAMPDLNQVGWVFILRNKDFSAVHQFATSYSSILQLDKTRCNQDHNVKRMTFLLFSLQEFFYKESMRILDFRQTTIEIRKLKPFPKALSWGNQVKY